jgi:hypothetical protein
MLLSNIGKLQPGGLHNATFDHDTLPQYTIERREAAPRKSLR